MTALVETAVRKISALPEIEQNIIARKIIDEIESDKKWDKLFGESEDVLSSMAREALDEFAAKKTHHLDASKL